MAKNLDPPGQPEPYEPPEEICEAVENFLGEVLRRVTFSAPSHDEAETFMECRICGEWDGHTDDCPIPAVLRWQTGGEK